MTEQFLNRFNSIQAKLITRFLVSVFIVLVVVIGFNQSVRNLALASADSSLRVQAEQVVASIDNFHQRNLQSFSVASNLPVFVEFFSISEEEQADEDVRASVLATLETLRVRPYDQFAASSFALLDLEGHNLIDTTSANMGTYEGGRDYVEHHRLSASPFLSTVYFEPARSGAYFYYSVPIRDNIAPGPIGILRVQVPLSIIQNIVLDTELEDDAHVVLVDENLVRLLDSETPSLNFRTIVEYEPTDIHLLYETLQIPRIPASQLSVPLPELADLLDDLDETILVSDTLHHDEHVTERIAVVSMETQPWFLLYGRHTGQFYAPVNQQSQATLALSLVLTIGAIAIAVAFARNLSKPITRLTEISRLAADGNLDVQADVSSRDEVGILAAAFNTMINELKQNKSTLEERVRERTSELSLANERLKQEIEERQRLEQTNIQLALESERRRILTDFIQNVSHEFKTPLSIINVQSHLISRVVGASIDERIDEIITQSKSIESLVNEMVLMSRLDNQDLPVATARMYVNDFVNATCGSMQQAFEQKDIRFEVVLSADGCYIENNSQLLSSAMNYVLDNALQFTEPGGEVRVQSMYNTDTVIITIRDSGIGIPDGDLERVFERFYRVDPARTTRGFGLGLPIAKRIIERFNGKIYLQSQLDRGTTVQITFPLSTGN